MNRFDRAWIISADTDLVPAIECVKRNWPEKELRILFPPGQHQADALIAAAHFSARIQKKHLMKNLLPESVPLKSGGSISRPTDWN